MQKTILLVLATLMLLVSCNKNPAGQVQMPARPITVANVAVADAPQYIEEIGNCTAYASVSIQAQVTGLVTGLYFTDGSDVKKGQLLVSIDASSYQATLDQDKGTLAQDQAQLEVYQLQYERYATLSKQQFVAKQTLDGYLGDVKIYEAKVVTDKANIEAAQINVDRCRIASPIDARVGEHQVDVGNLTSSNSSTALVSLNVIAPLFVDFTVAEDDLGRIRAQAKKGPLKIEVIGHDGQRDGELIFYDNTVKTGSGTVKLRGQQPNTDRFFWPGQFVNVRLILDTIRNAKLVPTQAIQTGDDSSYVFVVKDNATVESRDILKGERCGSNTVVTKGLEAGETVVVTGQLNLATGAKVKIISGNS
jgi:multidrug efflux system membrane fusion protein